MSLRVFAAMGIVTFMENSGDYKTFDKGENVVLTVEEVLDIAGLSSLEQRHQHAMNVYPSSNSDEELIYRLTGVEIDLDFQYVGSIGSTIPGFSNVECILDNFPSRWIFYQG